MKLLNNTVTYPFDLFLFLCLLLPPSLPICPPRDAWIYPPISLPLSLQRETTYIHCLRVIFLVPACDLAVVASDLTAYSSTVQLQYHLWNANVSFVL